MTLIANSPLDTPYEDPNYFSMDPSARYEIPIDNNGDAKEDLIFEFKFNHVRLNPANRDAAGTGGHHIIQKSNVTRIAMELHKSCLTAGTDKDKFNASKPQVGSRVDRLTQNAPGAKFDALSTSNPAQAVHDSAADNAATRRWRRCRYDDGKAKP